MKKLILFALFIMVMLPTFLQAQSKGDRHRKHKKSPEMRKEMRQYFENQMYPVLSVAHKGFDAKLPATELAFLQGKRTEAKQLQQEKKALHQEIRSRIKAGDSKEAARAAASTKIEALRGRKKALTASLKPFMEKNKSLIDKTVEELKPQHEKWQADRKAIRVKYMPEQAEKGKTEGKGQHAANGTQRKIARFVLWDGEKK